MARRLSPERMEQVLAALLAVSPPILRRFWRADSCIASTRDVVDALRSFQLRAEPLSVKVMVFNTAAWSEIMIHGRLPESAAEREEWWVPVAGHSLGLGYGDGQSVDGWPGHLVALVEGRWIVDLTLNQANRPTRGIVLPPLIFEPEPYLLERTGRQTLAIGDAVVVYEPTKPGYMHTEGWRASKDWNDPKRHVQPFALITAAMRQYMESPDALRDLSRSFATDPRSPGPVSESGVARPREST